MPLQVFAVFRSIHRCSSKLTRNNVCSCQDDKISPENSDKLDLTRSWLRKWAQFLLLASRSVGIVWTGFFQRLMQERTEQETWEKCIQKMESTQARKTKKIHTLGPERVKFAIFIKHICFKISQLSHES